jgi:polyferredoxin
MLVMWCGVWFDWMNYELFSAFLFNQAAWGVIVAALLFVALSFVVQRPYCRFVCPTGSLFRIAQNSK